MPEVLDTARLLVQSIRYTRPQQLVARASLQLRRHAHLLTGGLTAASAAPRRATPLGVAAAPPAAIFAPRTRLVSRAAGGQAVGISLANRPWRLRTPMDWHPGDLDPLQRFHLHYMEYLEGLDDRWFIDVVADWIRQNPPYQQRYWLDSWSAYTLSVRSVVWMQEYARRIRRLTPGFRALMEQSIAAQLEFLASNLETDLGGNHLLKNLKALLWGAAFFRGARADRWRAFAERLLAVELDEQILPDGCHFERSPSYHLQVLGDLLECRTVVAGAGLAARLDAVLPDMAQVAADLTHPDGGPSLFNDGGLHMAWAPADAMAAFAAVTGRTVEPRSSFALPHAGYFGRRDGTDLLVADCGRIGPDHLPAHAHGDILAFEWTVRGQRVVVDAGVSDYNVGAWRQYARSTRSHNTVTVGDADQCEFWKSFRVGRRADVTVHQYRTGAVLALDGSHDGFSHLPGAPVHRRRLEATPGVVDVSDAVTGGAGQPVVARLLLHPTMKVHRSPDGLEIRNGRVSVVLLTPHPVVVDHAWWCPDFNVRIPATQLLLRYGTAPCHGRFQLRHRL